MFFDTLNDYASNWLNASFPILVVAVFVAALWHVLNVITRFDDSDELFVKQNYAYAIQRISLCVAQVVGMLPVLSHSVKDDGWNAVGNMFAEGLWVFVALLLARPVVDYVLLYRVDNMKELLKGNLAVGITEAGFYVAFGFLLNGSLTGNAPSAGTGLASTVVFGLLGLAVVIGMFFVHEAATTYDLRKGIRDGRLASAIETAAMLVATAIVVRTGVAGDFTSWGEAFSAFFATVILTVVTLYIARWVIDRFVLTTCTVDEMQAKNQIVASIVLGSLLVLMAFPVEVALSAHL